MSEANGARPADNGFELDGEFYPWSLSDQGKDLMLIDRFTQMPVPDFFALIEDSEIGRGPIQLALIATSIRAKHPEWSVDRIFRIVQDINLSDVEFVGGDVEDDTELPPAEAAPPRAEAAPDRSGSTPGGSSSSSTLTGSSSSKTSSGAPA